MNEIPGLRWKPKWVSHLGCVQACLEAAGIRVTDAWLYGISGHAFIINLHETVCPSGPTAWDSSPLHRLISQIGCVFTGLSTSITQPSFDEHQRTIRDMIHNAIDHEIPVYGWELLYPEYYVIYGYDDDGYYFSGAGADDGAGPLPWQDLGKTRIGCLEVFTIQRKGEAIPVKDALRETLNFVIEHARNPAKWIVPKYKSGPAGYDNWLHAVQHQTADPAGMAYNTAVWHECRKMAAAFFGQLQEALPPELSPLLQDGEKAYQEIAGLLGQLSTLFPFRHENPVPVEGDAAEEAVRLLKYTRELEESALRLLKKLLSRLGA